MNINAVNVLANHNNIVIKKPSCCVDNAINKPEQTHSLNFIKNIIVNSLAFDKQIDLFDLLTSTIHTTCAGLSKTSEITFGLLNILDVDGDENTGINGKDIRVQYYILPWLEIEPELRLGAIFTVNIERIGEEIAGKEFNITASLGNNMFSLGYLSPESSKM